MYGRVCLLCSHRLASAGQVLSSNFFFQMLKHWLGHNNESKSIYLPMNPSDTLMSPSVLVVHSICCHFEFIPKEKSPYIVATKKFSLVVLKNTPKTFIRGRQLANQWAIYYFYKKKGLGLESKLATVTSVSQIKSDCFPHSRNWHLLLPSGQQLQLLQLEILEKGCTYKK